MTEFLIGSFPASFIFIFVYSELFLMQLKENKICQRLDSNRRSLLLEATTIPTVFIGSDPVVNVEKLLKCLNLHKNVKTLPFLSKTVYCLEWPTYSCCFSLGDNIDFLQK